MTMHLHWFTRVAHILLENVGQLGKVELHSVDIFELNAARAWRSASLAMVTLGALSMLHDSSFLLATTSLTWMDVWQVRLG